MPDALLARLLPKVAEFRRDIHAHPELALEERRTSGLVADYLTGLGLEVHRGLARTGVVAKLKVGEGSRTIGLRADMDALPLQELNEFAHRSRHDGCMHACGHDGHTAMLLGAAEALATLRRFSGTVYFIFQPAEEREGGGRMMIEEGLFDRFPMEMVFGLHNWPGLPAGSFSIVDGPVMAGTDRFELYITGRGGHAAMPHQASDVVVAGSALVLALQTLVSRNIDPADSAVVSVTRFQAGEAYNVLAAEAVLGGTVRALDGRVQDTLEVGLARICAGIAATYGVSIDVRYERGYPPTVNAPEPTALARLAAGQVVEGMTATDGYPGHLPAVLTNLPPSMGAEDFSYMAQARPGCYIWLGNGLSEGHGHGGCVLHSPHYDFNDQVIEAGIRYWVKLVETALV